jgi:two-component system phosphate regulon sensor histidine kinase PhoR
MLGFRRKIILADAILFLIFVALLFPFVESTVRKAKIHTLETRAHNLAKVVEVAPDLNTAEMILRRPQFSFVCSALYDDKREMIWESHPAAKKHLETDHSYSEDYSDYYKQTFGFVAIPITISGQKYYLQAGFPLQEIHDLAYFFKIGFLLFGTLFLFLFSTITQWIIYRTTRPIQQITRSIMRYCEGREEFLPRIVLKQPDQGREFDKIAFTLNSLSDRVQKEIDHLTQQRKETEGILESIGEGVIAFNPLGKITFANRVACKMLVSRHEDMIGKSLSEVPSKHPDLLQRGHELVIQVFQTSEPILQTWMEKSVARVYLDLIAAPLAQHNGAILVLQDKTSDYKVLEMGKDFVANASHELRTPITIIRGFAETLQDIPNISKVMLDEITGKIVRTCGRLDKLVKSLLTLADIENFSKLQFYNVDLKTLVENCKNTLVMVHPETKITIHSTLSHAYIAADTDLLEMAIQNLLDNAVKYSQSPATIEIRIRTESGQLFLDIQDKGIGIPEADMPHIFGRFYTVDKARSRKSGGAGLGLSIVKTIIEKHSGRIAVVSKVGQGTIFIISLPMKDSTVTS